MATWCKDKRLVVILPMELCLRHPRQRYVRTNGLENGSKWIGAYGLLQIGEDMEGTRPSPVHDGAGLGSEGNSDLTRQGRVRSNMPDNACTAAVRPGLPYTLAGADYLVSPR